MSEQQMSGAEMVLAALADNGVEIVFGYPGGAVLPIYDAMFQQERIRHVLVRQEGGAVHAAEGYARSTGRVGCVLVTSGPGATNAVTGLLDAQMDSIPLVCITGQVPTHLIGNDAFQEADTTGITRPCTKHNYLVKDVEKLAETLHEAFHVARSGRPGPVLVDLPKDIQFATGTYRTPDEFDFSYRPAYEPDMTQIVRAIEMIAKAERPLFYTGGGVINSGPQASEALTELVRLTGIPCTSTLMGLGAFPASDPQFLGMLGMHGTYEANLATHGCDLLVCVGARFDDRVTGKVSAFSPGSRKIHIDIDASSINKNVRVDLPVVGDAGRALAMMLEVWKEQGHECRARALAPWWKQIDAWRAVDCLAYEQGDSVIKPQYALERLREALKGRDNVYITTEVGQHQMWAAQFLPFDKPNHWMTSGGLGTMGYGLPAAVGVQMAHPGAIVIDVAGEASILMNIQEMSTAVQYRLPVKIFIMNNKWMGMVRQWQELLHGGRFSESYTAALPDFVKLADAFGGTGLRAETVADLDEAIAKMLSTPGPVILDVAVDETEMCFPMIPGGAAHNEIMLRRQDQTKSDPTAREEGMVLV
ncbi:MAG: acetolactate synthase [Rhodospirillales bacterium]|nr:acetolactate synthase [Rhodospirillales bacterium]